MKFPTPSIKHSPVASKDLLFRRRQPERESPSDGTVLRAVPPVGRPSTSHGKAKPKERRRSGGRAATPIVLGPSLSVPEWTQSRTPSVTSAHSIEGWSEVHADFLGVWKDGTVHWAPDMSDGEEERSSSQSSVRADSDLSSQSSLSYRSRRPKIQLTIPNQRISTTTMDRMLAPMEEAEVPADPLESASRITSTCTGKLSSLSSGHSTIRQSTISQTTISNVTPDLPLRQSTEPGSTETTREVVADLPQLGTGLSASSLSASSDDHVDDDASSTYSGRSSMSSATLDMVFKPAAVNRTASVAYSILSPVRAGVYDEQPQPQPPPQPQSQQQPQSQPQPPPPRSLKPKGSALSLASLANKPLPPAPLDMAPAPLNVGGRHRPKPELLKSASPKSSRSNSPLLFPDSPSSLKPPPRAAVRIGLKSKYSTHDLDALDQAFVRASPRTEMTITSLMEAEEALAVQLGTISEHSSTPPLSSDPDVPEARDPLQIARGPMLMAPSRAPPAPPTPTMDSAPVEKVAIAAKDAARHHKGPASPTTAPAELPAPFAEPRRDTYRIKWSKRAQKILTRTQPGHDLRVSLIDSPSSTLRSLPNTPVSASVSATSQASPDPSVWEITKRLELVKMKERSDLIRLEAFKLADTKKASELAALHCSYERSKHARYRAPSVILPPRKIIPEEIPAMPTTKPPGVPSRVSTTVANMSELPATPPSPFMPPFPMPATRPAPPSGIPADAAEQVLLKILQSLTNLQDLFSTAVVSKGFYKTFKRNELALMRNALKAMSPPAWELRETSPPPRDDEGASRGQSELGYTPKSFLQLYTRDLYVMVALKSLILVRCESFLRPETVAALAGNDDQRSLQLDDAFWRVWTFCKIFGSNKNSEDDLVGQTDWLRGGVIAHQDTCCSSLAATDPAIGNSSALLNPPDSFGYGNAAGLTPNQLWDMTEIWTCLSVLIHGFHGKRDMARQVGIFAGQDVVEGDIEREDRMIEEWVSYLLTLGPAVVLELATPSEQPGASGFTLAAENGWTKWEAPKDKRSRATFLKDAVTRVYEEKMSALRIPERSHSRTLSASAPGSARHVPGKFNQKSADRQRRLAYAADVRALRQSPEISQVPMAEERPMSTWSDIFRKLDPTPTPASVPAIPVLPSSIRTSMPGLIPAPLAQVDDPVDKAVEKLVGMGFPADLAKKALAETDTGENLNVQAATELCTRWTAQLQMSHCENPATDFPVQAELQA
ncbi:MAG: hypothetical protein M1838_005377 [Thelocarpon superellum]|nr:MAG: hypothetical protein M1838_005377 [Thelocarpon superellum]